MRIRILAVLFLSVLLAAVSAEASETDQYWGRERPIRDASPVIDGRVNAAIRKAIREWEGPRDDAKFAERVRWNVDGTAFVNRISFWADAHPGIDRLDTPIEESLYASVMPWESFVTVMRHLSATIAVDSPSTGRQYRFGADKLTHMLSVGYGYYRRYVRTGSEQPGIEYGWMTESQLLGYQFNGVFSNGDLVANYEGMRFYRSLSEDGIVPGKPAIIRWNGDRPVQAREFLLADHASEYWDESINTSYLRRAVARRARRELRAMYCDSYRASPSAYDITPAVEAELDERYSALMLRHNKALRVSAVCAGTP